MMSEDQTPPGYEALTRMSAEAADAVDEQVKRLETASRSGNAVAVHKEAAILAALVARQTTADQNLATKAALERLDDVNKHLAAASKTMQESVERFAQVTNESTKELGDWTKRMGMATIALAVFAAAQILVGVLAWLKPR